MTSPSLQELNKEAEKKEAAAEANRQRCRTCFKEIAPKRMCGGHGGGSGGGGSSGGSGSTSEEKASQAEAKFLARKPSEIDDDEEFASLSTSTEDVVDIDSQSKPDEERFNPEIIAELIASKKLDVNNDRDSMTLTISLLCEPDELSPVQRQELKKYLEAILEELTEFKKEHGIDENCFNIIRDEEGNILSLSISFKTVDLTVALYDAFIKQLANNLLPTPTPELQATDEAVEARSSTTPTPFSLEPKPEVEHDEDERGVFHPTPKPWSW